MSILLSIRQLAARGSLRELVESRRGVITLGLALLIHAPVVVIELRSSKRQPVVTEIADRIDSVEVDMVPMPAEPSAPVAAPDTEPFAAAAEQAPLAPAEAVAMATRAATPPEGSPDQAPVTEAPPAPANSATPLVLVAPSTEALGIAGSGRGANPFLAGRGAPGGEAPPASSAFRTARPDAPTVADSKRAVEQSMRAAIHAQDSALGLGPEGPVLNALKEATYGGLAPERGAATFVAVVDENGVVIDLRLVSSNDESGWADARARAVKLLAGKKIALRGAKGAKIQISITSDVVMPSGARPGPPVRPTFKDGRAVVGSEATSGGTSADVVKTYKVGSFDLADTAAKARRVVHARLVSITTL